MYKNIPSGIKKIRLDTSLHRLHKQGKEKSDFGMDNSSELLDDGFGLYSTVDLKKSIGPAKTEYFRIALIRKGTAEFGIGLEKYKPKRNYMVFGFPGQIFSLQNITPDFSVYYMLFSEEFIRESFLLKNKREQFPFLTFSGISCFELSEETAIEVEGIIFKINQEIKNRKTGISEAIRLYIQMILIHASRHYGNMLLSKQASGSAENLFTSFLKSVSEHFLTVRKVSDYAEMLHVSPDHLNRAIKSSSAKTAHELIDEMILMEAKAHLLHSKQSVAEIAYQLEFADPSHFNKFFKKLTGLTPLQFRKS